VAWHDCRKLTVKISPRAADLSLSYSQSFVARPHWLCHHRPYALDSPPVMPPHPLFSTAFHENKPILFLVVKKKTIKYENKKFLIFDRFFFPSKIKNYLFSMASF
jgi:hypothetical protein